MGRKMTRTSGITNLIALLLMTVSACSSDPEEALVVAAPTELDHAVVIVDGEEVGALAPLGPGPRWVSKFLDRLWGKNPVLDVVVLVIDLEGAPSGPHTVILQKPGFPDLQNSFNYPTDLEYGAVYVYFDLPAGRESDEQVKNPV